MATETADNAAVETHRNRFYYWLRSVRACRRHAGEKAWEAQYHRSLNRMFQAYRDLVFAKIGVDLGF